MPAGQNKNILNETQKALKKRAVRLAQTKNLIYPLVDLHSDFEKKYWRAYHCNRELIQEGNYLTATYCNTRWCYECNAIRSAKLINGYKPVLSAFKNKQFVTLSRPNVSAENLKSELDYFVKTFHKMINYLRRYSGVDIKGLRKIEVTYNWQHDDYHPHMHIIVNSFQAGKKLIQEWLFRNPEASERGQDMRIADETSFIELFKYATKPLADTEMSVYAMDTIFRSLDGMRIYQPFGIKKYVSEDINETIRQAYGMLEPSAYKTWHFNDDFMDWFASDRKNYNGESLIDANQYENSS